MGPRELGGGEARFAAGRKGEAGGVFTASSATSTSTLQGAGGMEEVGPLQFPELDPVRVAEPGPATASAAETCPERALASLLLSRCPCCPQSNPKWSQRMRADTRSQRMRADTRSQRMEANHNSNNMATATHNKGRDGFGATLCDTPTEGSLRKSAFSASQPEAGQTASQAAMVCGGKSGAA